MANSPATLHTGARLGLQNWFPPAGGSPVSVGRSWTVTPAVFFGASVYGIGLLALLVNSETPRDGIFLGLILASSAAAACWAWLRRSFSVVIYAGSHVVFGIAPLLASVLHLNWETAPDVVSKSNLIVLASIFCMCLGERCGDLVGSGRIGERRPWSPSLVDTLFQTCTCLALAGYGVMLWSMGTLVFTMLTTNRMSLRLDTTGLLFNFGRWLTNLSMIATYLGMARHRRLVPILFAIINCAAAGAFGDRSFVLYSLSGYLGYILTGRRRRRKALRRIALVGLVFVVGVIGLLHVFRWQQARDFTHLGEVASDVDTYRFILFNRVSDLNIRYALYDAVELFPSSHDWLYGNTYRTMLLFWLPSSWSGGLKVDTMYHFNYAVTGDYMGSYVRLESKHPTLFGDMYINCGYFFWVSAFFWGLAIQHVSRAGSAPVLDLRGIFVRSAVAYALVLMLRGSIYQPFFSCMVVLFFLLLYRLVARRPLQPDQVAHAN